MDEDKENDKLEAELKAAAKANKDSEPIKRAGKRIQVPSKNGKAGGNKKP